MVASSPVKPLRPFQLGARNEACSLVYPLPQQLPPVTEGDLRRRSFSLLHRALYITWSVLPSDLFHLYFMQNGSCEGCQLEGSVGLGPQGGACG